jgi:hypothetical protein
MRLAIHSIVISALLLSWTTAEAADGAKRKRLIFEALPAAGTMANPENMSCLFISNDCEVCALDAQDLPVCSSTGIACLPAERRCYRIEETIAPE